MIDFHELIKRNIHILVLYNTVASLHRYAVRVHLNELAPA